MKTHKINYRLWITLAVTIAVMGAWAFLFAGPAESAPAKTTTVAAAPATVERCPNNQNCGGSPKHYRNNDYRDPTVDNARNAKPMQEWERKVYMCGGLGAIAGVGAYYTKGQSVQWASGIAGASCGWTTLFQ